MEFKNICPKCKKTHTTSNWDRCAYCNVDLIPIKLKEVKFDDFNQEIIITYKIKGTKENKSSNPLDIIGRNI